MKQIILVAILNFTFCFVTFAQVTEDKVFELSSELKTLAEFNDTTSEWDKITVEIINRELLDNPSAIVLIRIKNDDARKFAKRLYRLRRVITFGRADLSRIIFLIVDRQEYDTDVLTAPDCSKIPKCEDCIIIRGIDIGKLRIPSKLKNITKKERRK